MNIQSLYKLIRSGNPLNDAHLSHLETYWERYTKAQLASLATQIILMKKRNDASKKIFDLILIKYKDLGDYFDALSDQPTQQKNISNPSFIKILNKTYANRDLADDELTLLFTDYQNGKIDDTCMAMWLMLASYRDLSKKNIQKIAHLCRDSGKIFDYRALPELDYRKLITRYPTGALSEKIALIMPSLICVFGDQYPIASNFLVAKSLGYTGGTWDKLAVIEGFTFPKQGKEVIEMIKTCHVAISVTVDQFNPLDERLYQLRSATGSVESIPLISISIASKFLAIPVDFLLIDLRFGPGAFAANEKEGRALDQNIKDILSNEMGIDFLHTEMNQPSGMGIGSRLELMEAITIMKDDLDHPHWDRRALVEQKNLVIKMFMHLMHQAFPKLSVDTLQKQVDEAFREGLLLSGFKRVLQAHSVSAETIEKLTQTPETLISEHTKFAYQSKQKGILTHLDQKALGLFVNFELSTGLNRLVSKKENGAGIILKARLGDKIEIGQTLCEVIATEKYILEFTDLINAQLSEIFLILE